MLHFSGPKPPLHLRSSQLIDLGLWLLWQRRRFRVVGESMVPLLLPNTEVLVNPGVYRRAAPQPGEMVVARHPRQPQLCILKWVAYVEGEDCFLLGINLAVSSDSRDFGLVPRDHLLGRVVCRFP